MIYVHMQLCEGVFQVVYPLGLWSRFSGLVNFLIRYGWQVIYIYIYSLKLFPHEQTRHKHTHQLTRTETWRRPTLVLVKGNDEVTTDTTRDVTNSCEGMSVRGALMNIHGILIIMA